MNEIFTAEEVAHIDIYVRRGGKDITVKSVTITENSHGLYTFLEGPAVKLQGSTGVAVWCGTTNHQLVCAIDGSDKTDFDDNYKSGSTAVNCEGDALSRIVTF